MTNSITKRGLVTCAKHGCQTRFVPKTDNHLYCSIEHKNCEAQRRLRQRARRNGKQK